MNALFRNLVCSVIVIVMAGFLAWPATPSADQAQYFYDELGRLSGVVDGTGNVAVYHYDPVGNLLSIERFTPAGTGVGIFLLAPTRALAGANVQIQGFGFDPTPGNNQVAFNGTTATVVSSTPTTIIASVPSGATSGPVTVTNVNGTATSPHPFTVLVPPIVTGITPHRAAQGTTSQLVIGGFNLADATAVTFTQAGLSATVLGGATANSLPITLAVGAAVPPGSYPFSVVSPAGTAQSGTVTVMVTPPVPSFSLNKGSVFFPFPAQTPPTGSSMSVAPPVSVSMP
ncbi:MAG: IPT/TIG domain-containing protein [Nitrospirota bacterium]